MSASEYTGPEEYRIGPDRVLQLEDAVLVYTPREMTDWQVREFCRMPIFFQGVKYYLLRKARGEPPFTFCYELAPWPADLFEESKLAIQYDEAYVARRDEGEHTDRIDEFGRAFLLPLYPFLGFLWSRFKDRKLERFGFNPASITGASLYLSLVIILGEVIFFSFLGQGFFQIILGLPTPLADCVLFAALPIDSVIRCGQVLQGVEAPDGFLEWLAKWIKRVMAASKRRAALRQ